MKKTTAGQKSLSRSAMAIIAGFLVVAIPSTLADHLCHSTGIFPPEGEPMLALLPNLIALAYRVVFAVAGGFVAARLAPRAPQAHANILGGIGLVLGTAGAIAASGTALAPVWFTPLVAATAFPCCWFGGRIYSASDRHRDAQLT